MPRYFFDFDDDDNHLRDDVGTELPGLSKVKDEAIGVLPEIAKDRLPDGMHHLFRASVRDETGTVIFIAKMVMDASWTDGSGPEDAVAAPM